jgi:rubrerythrin
VTKFFEGIARQSDTEAVREIFALLAKEESVLIEQLTRQFRAFAQKSMFLAEMDYQVPTMTDKKVLTADLKEQISAASYEAAAISATIAVYSNRAREATDLEECKLYDWLANWERGHVKLLNDLNNELLEAVWNDNDF